jgi:hypothetical protein
MAWTASNACVTARAASSASFQRRGHLNARQHDASSISNLGAPVSVSEDRWQWPTIRRAKPKAKEMSLALGLGPILVVGAIVRDHVVVDELDVTGLKLDIEII